MPLVEIQPLPAEETPVSYKTTCKLIKFLLVSTGSKSKLADLGIDTMKRRA